MVFQPAERRARYSALGHSLDGVRLRDSQTPRESELRRGDGEPVQRGHECHVSSTGERRAFQSLERGGRPTWPQLKGRLFIKDVLEQRLDGTATASPHAHTRDVHAGALQVALEPIEVLQQLRQLRVARLAGERALTLGYERSRERAVAVERS
jgi:hypothetical protein